MKQFEELKAKHPDAILLFRCGDSYEAYNEDADDTSDILGLQVNHVPGVRWTAFPHHQLDTNLPRLVRAGRRIAICDELQPPKRDEEPRGLMLKKEERREPVQLSLF